MFRLLATLFLKLKGFRIDGQFPELRSYVIAYGNHTSHWDTFLTIVATRFAGFDGMVRWMYAEKLDRGWCRFIVAPFLQHFGGFSVDRALSRQERVHFIAEGLRRGAYRVFGVAPEGRRGLTPYWKSGFYFVAREAELPVFLMTVDYPTKTIHLGPLVHLTGDARADMGQLRSHFSRFTAKFPDQVGPVSIREEEKHLDGVEMRRAS